jgi:thiol-disulfide isomerase/thioredoxin
MSAMKLLGQGSIRSCFLFAALMLVAVVMTGLGLTWIIYTQTRVLALSTDAQPQGPETAVDRPQAGGTDVAGLAPAFTLTDLNGNQVSLSHFSGRPVVVNFWATWCGPCRIELPHLIEAYERERDDVVFLAISINERKDTVRQFVEENEMPFIILLDGSGEVASDYRVKGIPTTFFISRDGEIVARYVGPMPPHRLEQGLDRIR